MTTTVVAPQEKAPVVDLPTGQPTQRSMADRLASGQGGKAVVEEDTEALEDTTPGSTPDSAVGSAAGDDDPAASEADDDTPDTDDDDGTPEGEEEDEDAGYEQRYKDTQAKLTETAQQLSTVRTEAAKQMAEIARERYALQDQYEEAEQVAQFWAGQAMTELQQLQQVNTQQLTQEQYAQWQQAATQAQRRAQQYQQGLQRTLAQSKQARDNARGREAAVARAQLTTQIPDWDKVYPEIGKFAVSKGVSPQVFAEITDPGLMIWMHEQMQQSSQPDVVEEITRRATPRTPGQGRNATSVTRNTGPRTIAERLYGK
jgi:hypothetical protein